jgi:heptosyltransferase-2
MLKLNLDCRHFRGDKPCRLGLMCAGCSRYEAMGRRILIIKLDAVGDVARTTALLRPLRVAHTPCHITWLAAPEALDLLRGNPLIEVALPYDLPSLERLRAERFGLVLSLDKTPRAAGVAMGVQAALKLGFGLSQWGTVYPLNEEAEYAFRLGLDDDLKFRQNRRTYQEVIFEVCRMAYRREEYELPVGEEDRSHAAAVLDRLGIRPDDTVVGLNLGGGAMFSHKMWAEKECLAFLRLLTRRLRCKVLLFGAKRERERMEAVLAAGLPEVFSAGFDNTLRQFQALLGRCQALVGGDSLGMHLGIAEKVRQVVLFGPTCPQEIELYDRGEKIVSPAACAPCYSDRCRRSPTCMEAISPAAVVEAVQRQLASEAAPA